MEFVGVVLVYTGLISAFLAGVSVIKPIRFLGILTRAKALLLFAAGLAVIAVGFAVPAYERRLAARLTLLDEFAPVYQFHEEHSIRVHASLDNCYAAIRDVSPEEIALFRTLTWIRRFGQRGPESILNAPEHRPLIEAATRTGFTMLADDRKRELVVGAVMGRPGPEWARALRSPDVVAGNSAPRGRQSRPLAAHSHKRHANQNQRQAEQLLPRNLLLEEDSRPDQRPDAAQRNHRVEHG